MKKSFLILALGAFLAIPCVLRAEEVEIQLMEVIQLGSLLPGDDPLDNPEQSRPEPTRPTDFRASIDGTSLSINRQNNNIPSAQATVVNAQTGSILRIL